MHSWIGVADSGVGGLSVWRELARLMPHENLLYYADTASCPYGGRGRRQIVELGRQVVEHLMTRGVKIIVVACNTMTAAAIDVLRADYPEIPFVGMEPAVKPAVAHSHRKVVGILATKATLSGELYNNTKRIHASSVDVIEVAGTGLVEMVERGMVGSEQCDDLLRTYIDPMVERGADTLVLGCTHFPFLEPAIRRIYGDGLMLENPAPAVARRTYELLSERGELASPDNQALYEFFTSGTKVDLERLKSMASGLGVCRIN